MTEKEWLGDDTWSRDMLTFIVSRLNNRKLRLLVAGYRRYHHMTMPTKAQEFLYPVIYPRDLEELEGDNDVLDILVVRRDKSSVSRTLRELVFDFYGVLEYKWASHLLRHITGNPFHPYPKPASWSSTILQLAESLP